MADMTNESVTAQPAAGAPAPGARAGRRRTPAIIVAVVVVVIAVVIGGFFTWQTFMGGSPVAVNTPGATQTGSPSAPPSTPPTPDTAALAVPSVPSFSYGYTTAWTAKFPLCARIVAQTDSVWVAQVGADDKDYMCGLLVGLDAKTGKIVWTSPAESPNGPSACAVGLLGNNLACLTSANTVELVDASTGSIVKSVPLTNFFPKSVVDSYDSFSDAPPTIAGGSLIITGDAWGSGGEGPTAMTARVSGTLAKVWTTKEYPAIEGNGGGWYYAALARLKADILVNINPTVEYLLNFKTGAFIAAADDGGFADVFDKNTLVTSGTATSFTLPDGGTAKSLSGDAVWFPSMSDTPPYPLTESVSFLDNGSFWDGTTTVSAVDPATGKRMWAHPLTAQNNPGAAPNVTGAYRDGVLALADSDGNVYRLDPATGAVAWQSHYPVSLLSRGQDEASASAPVLTILTDGTVLVEDDATANTTTAFDPTSGDIVWTTQGYLTLGDNTQLGPLGPSLAVTSGVSDTTATLSRLDPAPPNPRVASMPDAVPSCPDGWAVSMWSSWTGGNALACRTAGKASYYLAVTTGSQTLSTTTATRTPAGSYAATFPSGQSAVVSLGGSLVQVTSDGATTTTAAPTAWMDGRSTGFATPPPGDLPPCASGSSPVSLSVVGAQWLLTCGTASNAITGFSYNNGTATASGQAMTGGSGKYCGKDTVGDTVCAAASSITVASGKSTTAYPVASAYTPNGGAVNSPAFVAATSDADAQAKINAEVLHDTSLAKASATNRWVPQLSAKWSGITVNGKTWGNTDIWTEFGATKAKYPTALLLKSTDWSTLGLTGHSWYTTVAGVSFSDATDANRWCYAQGFGPNDCFAVQLGHGAAKNTLKKWKATDFGG